MWAYTSNTSKQISKIFGSGGIRTHASEETGALNQRLRPLGHATSLQQLSLHTSCIAWYE